MRNLLITLCFDGSGYCGYQVQKNGPTVAAAVQNAVEDLVGERIPITGCSRTDSGVHADMFCINFHTRCTIPAERVPSALNARLPKDIAVYQCREMPQDFHARYSCHGKLYRYQIYTGPYRNPFYEKYSLHHPYPLDLDSMNQAAESFKGEHEFSGFCSAGSSVRGSTRRHITRCEFQRKGDLVCFFIAANGFLYNMVRIMTGTLMEVSAGKRSPQSISELLARPDRTAAGPTVPAQGLFLQEVYY